MKTFQSTPITSFFLLFPKCLQLNKRERTNTFVIQKWFSPKVLNLSLSKDQRHNEQIELLEFYI